MRYFIGYIVTIGLLIVLILFLVSSGGSGKKGPTPELLNSYASTDAEVRLVIDGPINSPQQHQSIRITVSAFEATYEQLQGYDGDVTKTLTFDNTENSYYAFLSALMQAGYTRGANITGFPTSTGLCPTGDRYNFALIQNGQEIQNYWATSCGGMASYKGSVPLTLQLFQAQIPNYNQASATVLL